MADIKGLNSHTVSRQGIKNIEKYLNELGFTIKTFDRFPKFAKIIIPENYTANLDYEDDSCRKVIFYDEQQIEKGYFYINKNNDMGSTVILKKRLGIFYQKLGTLKEIYFGTENVKLLSTFINIEVGSPLYDGSNQAVYEASLKAEADKIYPDWKSPLAYWELTEEELLAMLPQKEELGNSRVRITK